MPHKNNKIYFTGFSLHLKQPVDIDLLLFNISIPLFMAALNCSKSDGCLAKI